jgi:predicted DCC family thiol-disulfide oxidoreductase YuxK
VTTSVFVFDGDCAFCSACAAFIQRRIPTPAAVVPWQRTDLARWGLTAGECQQAVQWTDSGTSVAGPVAIAALLRSSRGFWRPLGWLLSRRSVLVLAWPVYRWVARHRDQMPGGTAACALPMRDAGNA